MAKVTYKLPNVVQKRTELAWSQKTLATTATVGLATIKNIEKGSHISLVITKKLARAFDCPWEELTQGPLLPSVADPPTVVDNPNQETLEVTMPEAQTVPELRAELENTKLKEENQTLRAQLETANSHQRLGAVLAHAREACTDCRQDLEQHNQRVIQSALEGLEPAAARELALAKGVLPMTFSFQV